MQVDIGEPLPHTESVESVDVVKYEEPLKSSDSRPPQPQLTPSGIRKERFQIRDVLFPPATYKGGLIEQFLVVGVPHTSSKASSSAKLEAEILFSYPSAPDGGRSSRSSSSSSSSSGSVESFCFPEGITIRSVQRSYSGSALNQLVHGSDQAFSRRHVFCFTSPSDGSYMWGVCLVKEELLSNPPSFLVTESVPDESPNKEVDESQRRSSGSTSDKPYLAADRCYCLITRYPLFSLHYDVLLSVLACERAYRLSGRIDQESSPALDEIKSVSSVILDRNINCPVSLDLFSRQIRMDIPFQDCAPDLDKYFADVILQQSFPVMLQKLSVQNILRIFNTAVLCKQVLVRSRFCGVASAICLATSLLLRPLRWEGILVPVLPHSMQTALMAPVPFIIGITSTTIKIEELNLDGILVDADFDKVYFTSKFPVLPASNQLYNNVAPLVTKSFPQHSRTSHRPAFDPSADQKAASLQVASCFKAFNTWLIGKLMIHIDSNSDITNTKALRASFLPSVTPQNREFVQGWLQSQHVSVFLEHEFAKRAVL